MATYRAIASSETDPDAPVTSELMAALAANPLAIAEGASGAPPIISNAFEIVFALRETAPFSVTDLGNETVIAIFGEMTVVGDGGAATVALQASFSDDNGSTWGVWASIFEEIIPAAATTYNYVGSATRGLFARNAVRFRVQVISGTVTSSSGVASVVGLGSVA